MNERQLRLRQYAAFQLANDPHACEGLLRGQTIPSHRLNHDTLRQLGLPEDEPLALDDKLALRVELLSGERPPLHVVPDDLLLLNLAEVKPKKVRYLLEPLILEGMLNGLAAEGGVGKGLFGMMLAKHVVEATDRNVVLVYSEDSPEYLTSPRALAAGIDPGRLALPFRVDLQGQRQALRFPADMPVLRSAISRANASLVVIDPIGNHLNQDLDAYKDTDVRQALQPLADMASELDITVLVVYHLSKEGQPLGSVAFKNACRALSKMWVDPEDEDIRWIKVVKAAHGRAGVKKKFRVAVEPVTVEGEMELVPKLIEWTDSGYPF